MCGRNATTPLFPIKTIKLAPGDTIGFGAMRQSAKFGGRDEDKDMSDVSMNILPTHPPWANADWRKSTNWYCLLVLVCSGLRSR